MKALNFKGIGFILIVVALEILSTVSFAALPTGGGKTALNRALLAALDKQQIETVQLLVKGGASKLDIDLALMQRLPSSVNKDGVYIDNGMLDALAELGLADTTAIALSAVKNGDNDLLRYFLDRDAASNDEFELGLELKNKLWLTLVESWDEEIFSSLLTWRTSPSVTPAQIDGLDEALLIATNKNDTHIVHSLVNAIVEEDGLATALQAASSSDNGKIIGILLLKLFGSINNLDRMSEVADNVRDVVIKINTKKHGVDVLNEALSEIFNYEDYSFGRYHFEAIKLLVEAGATNFHTELQEHLPWLSQYSTGYGGDEWLLGKLIELKVANPSVVIQAVVEAKDIDLLYFLLEHSKQLKEAMKNLAVEFMENWRPDALEFILPAIEIETDLFDRILAKAIEKNNTALAKSIISNGLFSDNALRTTLNQANTSGNWEIVNFIEENTYLGNTVDNENFDWEQPNDDDYSY